MPKMASSSDMPFRGTGQTTTTAGNPSGSTTQVSQGPSGIPVARQPVLHLRGASIGGDTIGGPDGRGGRAGRGPRIRWAEDVVDNEGLGRKKSKG